MRKKKSRDRSKPEWTMQKHLSRTPNNLELGGEYEVAGLALDAYGTVIMSLWNEHSNILASEQPNAHSGIHQVLWQVGGSRLKKDHVCGKKLSLRLFCDEDDNTQGPSSLFYVGASPTSSPSLAVADSGNQRLVILHLPEQAEGGEIL
mmetsp:Transcript_14883/g.21697  ORF Transcript_14883/g.21697 Transcript_14883/m.21697 type:complete len:148 (-) Transcript_14883:42-485(-)